MRLITVDLRSLAIAESRRLGAARTLLRDVDQGASVRLEGDAAWIAVSRRTRLRQSLGRRACLIWRVAFEDASGRIVESKVVPVLIEMPLDVGSRRRSAAIRRFVQQAEAIVRPRVEAECGPWRAEVVRLTQAFWSARLYRLHGALGRGDHGPRDSQPGLFDRRVERALGARLSTAEDAVRLRADRVLAVRASAHVSPLPPQLMLVLVT